MINTLRSSWITTFLALCLVVSVVVLAQNGHEYEYYCGWETYGSPRIQDCRSLLESFANYRDTSVRFFDEEQLRADIQGSWPGAASMLGPTQLREMVQMPRYYTSSA